MNRILTLLLILILEFSWFFYSYHDIDNELIPYNNFFINELQNHCTNNQYFYPRKTSIKIEDMTLHDLGVCKLGLVRFEIILNKQYWDILDEDTRFETIIHEYTHCFLRIDHTDDLDHYMYKSENNLPKDIVVKQFRELLKEKCGN